MNEESVITTIVKKPMVVFAVCSVFGLLGGMLFSRDAIANQLEEWRVLPRPERVTELYFSGTPKSPTVPGGDQYKLAFKVRNLENRATNYHYEILAVSQKGEVQQLGKGSFVLEKDGLLAVRRTLDVLLPHAERTALTVNLTYEGMALHDKHPRQKSQSIHYWLPASTQSDAAKETT